MPVIVFSPSGDVVRMWGNPTPHEGTIETVDPYVN